MYSHLHTYSICFQAPACAQAVLSTPHPCSTCPLPLTYSPHNCPLHLTGSCMFDWQKRSYSSCLYVSVTYFTAPLKCLMSTQVTYYSFISPLSFEHVPLRLIMLQFYMNSMISLSALDLTLLRIKLLSLLHLHLTL